MNRALETVRSITANGVRATPDVKGRGRLARIIHGALPSLPENTIRRVPMRLGHAMEIDLGCKTEYPSFYTGDYDTRAIVSALRLLKPDAIALDVGANVGFWAVPLAAAAQTRRVYCFEPLPSNFQRLQTNIAINGLAQKAFPFQLGLSDAPGTLSLSLRDGATTGNAAIVIDDSDRALPCVDIPVDTFDHFAAAHSIERVDFIKIDIEGHEDKFFAGAKETIARDRPIILSEINHPYYERRNLDPVVLFEAWQAAHKYVSFIRAGGQWRRGSIQHCARPLDDAYFVPEEAARATGLALNV